MFDARKKEWEVPIMSGGEKRCVVRFPSDEEWDARTRRQKAVRRFLGRDKSESEEIGVEESDLQLFEAIRLDKETGVPFDGAEASMVLTRLEHARVLRDPVRLGDRYRIELKVAGARVAHELNIPSAAQMRDYERASMHIVSGRRHIEMRAFLAPAGQLWDALVPRTEGYAEGSPIPVVHKFAAIAELLREITPQDEDDPED